MKFILLSLFIMVLAVSYGVFAKPAGSYAADSGILNVIDAKDYAARESRQVKGRYRRACACQTTTGRCVPYGNYQCYFNGGASIVQCVGGDEWVTIGKCPSSCRTLSNDQPYCF